MEKVKSEIPIGVVLIAVLGIYGWRLSKDVKALTRQRQFQQAIVDKNQTAVFQSEAGIDVLGKPVYPLPPPEAERTIIFLLHGSNVGSDLNFWRHVQSLLPKNAGLRLVGYCDGDTCADAVRGDAQPPDFPVIEYGEITNSQALVNEDEQGYSILRSERWFQPKRVGWRTPGKTPLSVVREALQ